MDAYEVVDALNKTLDLGDRLDDSGLGVKFLSDGEYTTRQMCQSELTLFLLYIASGNGSLTDGEVALLNLVSGQEYSASKLMQIASSRDEPKPTSCMTLMGFVSADIELSRQSGERTTTTTDFLISVFEALGNLMVAFDENPVSKARCDKFINGMKTYVMKKL